MRVKKKGAVTPPEFIIADERGVVYERQSAATIDTAVKRATQALQRNNWRNPEVMVVYQAVKVVRPQAVPVKVEDYK